LRAPVGLDEGLRGRLTGKIEDGRTRKLAVEYVHNSSDGSTLWHYFDRVAIVGGNMSRIELVLTDSDLNQYQAEVNQILNSFQVQP